MEKTLLTSISRLSILLSEAQVWLGQASTDPEESQAWFGGYQGPDTVPNSQFECGHL